MGGQDEFELIEQEREFGFWFGVAGQQQLSAVGRRDMQINHLHGGELFDGAARREARRQGMEAPAECDMEAIGEEGDEDMRLGAAAPRPLSLFPEDRCEGLLPDAAVVRLKLAELRLCRPRQWGGCWLALKLWRELALDRFWAERLGPSRKGTRWHQVLLLLATYRLLAPGSEWRLHRQWFEGSAMADLLGEDVGLAEIHKLYRCHDRLLEHKQALFDHLVGRWRDLFNVSFDVLLYDLTSTYFGASG